MTDKQRMVLLAIRFGDEYKERPKSLIVPNWRRRFTFDETGEMKTVQDVKFGEDGEIKGYTEPMDSE